MLPRAWPRAALHFSMFSKLPTLVLFLGSASSASAMALPSSALTALSTRGFAVLPDWLPPTGVIAVKRDVVALRREGRFAAAGVGDAKTNRMDESVRSCEQCFLFPQLTHSYGGDQAGRALLYGSLSGLASDLQQSTGTPLDGLLTEGLFAYYPDGGFYKRHIDSVLGTASEIREFSYLLYLNEGWEPGDGGELRIHTDGGTELAPPAAAPSYVDVPPRAGTLVLFESTLPHEVLETNCERLAVAGWFNRPVAGSTERRTLITTLAGALVVGGVAKLALAVLGGD